MVLRPSSIRAGSAPLLAANSGPDTQMNGFEARLERLELKYLVNERTAARLRTEIAPYCQPDPHFEAARAEGHVGYPIASLYLDSPGLAFHRAKERGDAERVKLRVRTYERASYAVLEIKRRSSDVIDKSRARVDRRRVEAVVYGEPAGWGDDATNERSAEEFASLALSHGAEPALRIRYLREAYASTVDDYARITFDRCIEAQRASTWALASGDDHWVAFDDHWRPEQRDANVVLEIKCHCMVPTWITDVIQRHRLRRTSFSKYSIGIDITDRARGLGGLMRRSARVMA